MFYRQELNPMKASLVLSLFIAPGTAFFSNAERQLLNYLNAWKALHLEEIYVNPLPNLKRSCKPAALPPPHGNGIP